MSLILDALNRADQERKQQEQVPDIHTIHFAAARPQPGRRRWKIPFILLGVLLLVGLASWLLFRPAPNVQDQSRPGETAHASRAVSASPQTAVPKQAPVTTPSAKPAATPSEPSAAPQSEVAELYSARPESESPMADTAATSPVHELYEEPAAEQAGPTPIEGHPDMPVADAGTSQAESQPMDAAEALPSEVASQSQAIVTPFAPQPKQLQGDLRYLDSIPNVPFFNDLPWSQKQQIPTISYSRHDYLPNGISSVVINGETRGVGNQISGQFLLEDIVSDGVVLRYQEKRFKLKALNGWVNM